jgi:hypothetical protein
MNNELEKNTEGAAVISFEILPRNIPLSSKGNFERNLLRIAGLRAEI